MDLSKIGAILLWAAILLVSLWLLASISWFAVKLIVLAGAVYGAVLLFKHYLL